MKSKIKLWICHVTFFSFLFLISCDPAINPQLLPVLVTSQIVTITSSSAICGGNISSDGGFAVIGRGVCWSTAENPTIADNKTLDGTGLGAFISTLTGLIEGQTYYLRAYATNSEGTSYGNQTSFTTQVFIQETAFAKIYATLGLTGNLQPAGDADIHGYDEVNTDFFRSIWMLNEMTSDEDIPAWSDAYDLELYRNHYTTSNVIVLGIYERLYFNISLCNNFILETSGKTDQISIRECAEVRFLRALNYYYLLDLFGSGLVPDGTDYVNTIPKTRLELFDFIKTELTQCEPNMSDAQQAPYGRADKVANWLLLSRLYLNAEVYTGLAHWDDAANFAKKVIDSEYRLCTTFKYLFMADNDGSGSVNTARNEIILPIIADGVTAKSWGSSLFLIASTHLQPMISWGASDGWAGNRARAALVKKFFPTGSTFFSDTKDLTTAVLSSQKDNRALFDKSSVSNGLNINTVSDFRDGYSVIKFKNIRADGGPTGSTQFVDMDIPFFRAAEAYLTYAEAKIRTNNPNEALITINQLRTRASATLLTSIDLPTILDEKAREFFFEGQRRTDLIRFGYFGGSTTYVWDWKGGVAAGASFSADYNLFPIPQTALDANPNLHQNPGY